MKNQNFDKFLKNNADERSFDFNESFWNEMETLIDEQDKSIPSTVAFNWKKLWIAGLFCVLIGSIAMFFKWQTSTVSKNNIENEVAASTKSVEKTPQSIILNKKETNEITTNNTSSSSIRTEINSPKEELITVVSNSRIDNKNQSSDISSISKAEHQKNKVNNKSINSGSKNNKSAKPEFEISNPTKNKLQKTNNKKTLDEVKEPKPIAISTNSDDDNSSTNKEASDIPLVTNKMEISDANVIEEWVYLISDINPLVIEPMNLGAFPTFAPDKETGNNGIKPQKNFQIGVIIGSHFYQGYKNIADSRIPFSNDYFGGLYLKTTLNKKWSNKVGLNYWQRDALNSVISADSTVYGFGETVYSKTINLHGVQAIELPISVAYNFGKSAFSAGVQMSYIFNAKGTYQETVSDAFSTIHREETTQNGYQTAFNRLDFGMSLGYEYKVTDLINLGAQAQVGFVDVTKNSVFKNKTIDRNLMLKVYATYDFWSFTPKRK